jgi:hypothetical protein
MYDLIYALLDLLYCAFNAVFCLTVYYLKDLDQVLVLAKKSLPALKYLSLLGNEACPDQLSNHEHDDDDYYRYR